MEIAIDITPIRSEHSVRGTGTYTKLLIDSLQKYENKHSYTFFTRGQNVPEKAEIVHYPYFDPFFLTLPLVKSKPTIVTVHDLIPIAFKSHFHRGIKGEIKWQIQKHSLSGAKEIITDSMSSKADIIRLTNTGSGKVHVVYLAPRVFFKPIKYVNTLRTVIKKYNLPKQYLLYVGDVNWNKNILGLLNALKLLDSDIPLVMVGKAFLNSELREIREIEATIKDLSLENLVIKTGFVPEEDLPVIYSLASVYVQPSIAEGFGLPILEAMSCGCPVVASAASSLKEIAGPSVMVDPQKPDKIAKGINSALKIKRETWQKDSKAWLTNFSPEKLAKETVEVYKKAIC